MEDIFKGINAEIEEVNYRIQNVISYYEKREEYEICASLQECMVDLNFAVRDIKAYAKNKISE